MTDAQTDAQTAAKTAAAAATDEASAAGAACQDHQLTRGPHYAKAQRHRQPRVHREPPFQPKKRVAQGSLAAGRC